MHKNKLSEWQTDVSDIFFSNHPCLLAGTVQILCIGTDRSQQTVQTKIRLLLKKQSD